MMTIPPRQLTVLFYMNGEYGDVVGQSVIDNLQNLQDIGSTDSVQLVAELGQKTAEGTHDLRRYALGKAGEKAEPVWQSDSSITDPKNLRDFLSWGMRSYPAEHYLVVYQGHGGAWKGALSIPPVHMQEAVNAGVAEANQASGRHDHLDAQVFNTCLLSNLEALSQLKGTSDVIVASEDVAQLNINANWGQHLEWIRSQPGFDAKDFAKYMVDLYRGWQQEGQGLGSGAGMARIAELQEKMFSYKTLTAIDTSKLPAVEEALRTFLTTSQEAGVRSEDLFSALAASRDFMAFEGDQGGAYHYTAHLRDAGDIMDHVSQAAWASEPVRAAAREFQARLGEAIIDEQHLGLDPEGLHGITLWAPTHAGVAQASRAEYAEKAPELSRRTGWGDFLAASTDARPAALREEFVGLGADRIIKDFQASQAQQGRLEGYPAWIAREEATLERKRAAGLESQVAEKEALLTRLRADLETARTTGPALQQALIDKRARLAELDPVLRLTN